MKSDEPHSRLTRLAAAMTDALDAHPEAQGNEKCIVFLQDGKRGGIQIHGYEDEADAIRHLFVHLRAIFNANGSELMVTTIGEG